MSNRWSRNVVKNPKEYYNVEERPDGLVHGLPLSREDYIHNMAIMAYGAAPTNEEFNELAEHLGMSDVTRREPEYVEKLKKLGALNLLENATEAEMVRNDALEMFEDEDDLGTTEENNEKRVLKRILAGMKLYKEKDERHMFFHLMYWREISLDVREELYKDRNWHEIFSCRCITSEGQIHYHALVQQCGIIHNKHSIQYYFKKASRTGQWRKKPYKVKHILTDHHFVNACTYPCVIKGGRNHGPHSERLIPITDNGRERVWHKVAEVYPNLFKEKVEENKSYHLKMKKSQKVML